MEAGRCAICGRPRTGGDAYVDPAGGTWASCGGQDLCPEHQTPGDRREALRRALAQVKDWSERLLNKGIPAGDVERQLLLFALKLQEELDAAADDEGVAEAEGQRPPGSGRQAAPLAVAGPGPAVDDAAPARTESLVAITGAFLTGSEPVVRIKDYAALQKALKGVLGDAEWEFDRSRLQPTTYQSGGGFTDPLPLIVARRQGQALVDRVQLALKAPPHAPGAALEEFAPGYELTPTTLRIDLYDLGMAVLTAWFTVSAPSKDWPAEFAATVKRLSLLTDPRSPLAESLRVIAVDTAEAYRRAIQRALPAKDVRDSWLQDARDIGRLLWLHPVHVVDQADPNDQAAEALGPVFQQRIKVAGGILVSGIGWSAVLAVRAGDGVEASLRLTQRHWAYFALYMELDRALLQTLNDVRSVERAKRKELEQETRDAFDVYLRVMEARARLDSELSSLGGDEQAIWDAIAQVQRFDTIVAGVERKLEVLQKLTERRAEEAVDLRARRISEGLSWLAALTIVTVTFAGIAYFFGARKFVEDREAIRLSAVVIAGLIAVGLLLFVYMDRGRPPRRRARRRQ